MQGILLRFRVCGRDQDFPIVLDLRPITDGMQNILLKYKMNRRDDR